MWAEVGGKSSGRNRPHTRTVFGVEGEVLVRRLGQKILLCQSEDRRFLDCVGDYVPTDTDVWNEECLGCVVNSVELRDGEDASAGDEGAIEVDTQKVLPTELARQNNRGGKMRSDIRGEVGRIDGKDHDRQHGA